MKKTTTTNKTKASKPNTAKVVAPKKVPDLEAANLKGQVKRVMQISYKAHSKGGEVIKGALETGYTTERQHFIVTFNKKGWRIEDKMYGEN